LGTVWLPHYRAEKRDGNQDKHGNESYDNPVNSLFGHRLKLECHLLSHLLRVTAGHAEVPLQMVKSVKLGL